MPGPPLILARYCTPVRLGGLALTASQKHERGGLVSKGQKAFALWLPFSVKRTVCKIRGVRPA
jgi:hypothetical protein